MEAFTDQPEGERTKGKGKIWVVFRDLCVTVVLFAVSLALDPVAGEEPLPRDTRQVQHPDYSSLPFPEFFRHLLINHFIRKKEQLYRMRIDRSS